MAHQHTGHPDGHQHGPDCGHEAVQHGDHTDYLVDGHLHHPHGDHCDDHCEEEHEAHVCEGHDADHTHGPDCGHEAVQHGDHTDYVVDGHLHHPHAGHCDDHGSA